MLLKFRPSLSDCSLIIFGNLIKLCLKLITNKNIPLRFITRWGDSPLPSVSIKSTINIL